MDLIEQYARNLGRTVGRRNIIVEGTTDVELLEFAAIKEFEKSGTDLFSNEFQIVPSGVGDLGGAQGVVRVCFALWEMSASQFDIVGKKKYRFIGLLDNDHAGIKALNHATSIHRGVVEYRDILRLWPVMATQGNTDPNALKRTFERLNDPYKGLFWEIEDYIGEEFLNIFESLNTSLDIRKEYKNGLTHRKFSSDSKAALHRQFKAEGDYDDCQGLIQLLRSLRFSIGLNPLTT